MLDVKIKAPVTIPEAMSLIPQRDSSCLVPFSASLEDVEASSFLGFVEQACESLKIDPSGTRKICVRGSNGKLMDLGKFFAKTIKQIALPTEITKVENRYGIKLSKLEAKKELSVQEILAFATAFTDSTQDTEAFIKEGQRLRASRVAKFTIARLKETEGIRSAVSKALAQLDLETCSKSLKKIYKLEKDLYRLQLASQELTLEQFQEVLTKKLASSFLEEGMKIPLPRLIDPSTGKLSDKQGFYVIKKKISEKGLMAFALVPENAPEFIKTTILFRPTTQNLKHENALLTFADDLGDMIGKRSYDSAKVKLKAMLDDPSIVPANQKVVICGFSLGGAHAARLLADFPDKFSHAIFFNDPSTEEACARTFIENLASSTHSSKNPMQITIIHTDKDMVTHAGDMHVGHIDPSFKGADLCEGKFNVTVKKIITDETESDLAPTPTLHLTELFWAVISRNLQPIKTTLKTKASHHTKLVLKDVEAAEMPITVSPKEDAIKTVAERTMVRRPSKARMLAYSPEYLNRGRYQDAKVLNAYRANKAVLRTFLLGVLIICHTVGKFFGVINALNEKKSLDVDAYEAIIKKRLAPQANQDTLYTDLKFLLSPSFLEQNC